MRGTVIRRKHFIGRRLLIIVIAALLVAVQFAWLGSSKVSADSDSLTLIYEGGEIPLAGYPSDIASMNVSRGYISAVATDGRIYTNDGRITDLSNVDRAFVSDNVLNPWTGFARRSVGFAIKDDGSLWSWGNGVQLGRVNDIDGDGINEDDIDPGQILGLPPIREIEIGESHILALDYDGNVWSWGNNNVGQLGTDSDCPLPFYPWSPAPECDIEPRILPLQIPGITNASDISAGATNGAAVMADGSLKFWGVVCNIESTWPYYPSPVTYTELTGSVEQVIADECSITTLMSDGSVYTWGMAGQRPTSPVLFMGPEYGIESIKGDGGTTKVARDQSGFAYRWGQGVYSTDVPGEQNGETLLGDTAVCCSLLANDPPVLIGSLGMDTTYFASRHGSAVVLNYVSGPPDQKMFVGSGSDLFSFSLEGRGSKVLSQNATEYNVSPDGERVAYARDGDIFRANIDGSNEVNLTNSLGTNETQPVWSPDGEELLLSSFDSDWSGGVFIMDSDGSNPHLVVPNSTTASWSPDGSKVLFENYPESGPARIGMANNDGSNVTFLTSEGDEEWVYPAWSPDGTRIAWMALDNDPEAEFSSSTISVMNINGTGRVDLFTTSEDVSAWPPAWSPDSSKIAFIAEESGMTRILLIPAVGGSAKLVKTIPELTAGGNLQWLHLPVNEPVDSIPPILSTPTWSQNPKPTSGTTTLTVPATDETSGVASGEYFLGDTDPGQGNGAAMAFDGTNLTTTFGTDFPTGVYKVTVRAVDNAGNWSEPVSDYLVVYNPDGPRMTGKRTVLPSLANGDILLGLINSNQDDKATFAFNVKYNNQGQISGNSDLQFKYTTGTHCNKPSQAQNCHKMTLNASSIAWLTTQGANDSTGIFQGTATMKLDGQTSTVLFRVTGIDGERFDPSSDDHFTIKIYAEGANPNTDEPLYQVSSVVTRGNIRIIF